MGGQGSGRKPDPVKALIKTFNPPQRNLISGDVLIPDYSGVAQHEQTLAKFDERYTNKAYVDDAIAGFSTNHDDLGNLNWSVAEHIIDTDVNFQKYKAVAMACDNGSTLPSSPVIGQWFLHTPTGRNVLMMYDGSNWISILNLGETTIYVDGGSGTDDIAYGGSSGAGAFATIQYAIDSLAGLIGGNVVINIASGTYSEKVTIGGKNYSGAFSISLIGELSSTETISSATVAAGTGATQGTVTDTELNGDDYSNYLCYFNTDDEYRLIDSHSSTTLTLVGTAPSSTTQNCTIYDWGTIIDGTDYAIVIGEGQKSINFYNIKFTGSSTLQAIIGAFSSVYFYQCKIDTSQHGFYTYSAAYIEIWRTFITSDQNKIMLRTMGAGIFFRLYGSKFINTQVGKSGQGCVVSYNSAGFITSGCIFDGFSFGFNISDSSIGNCYSAAADGYLRIRNCATGAYCGYGAIVRSTANNVYSGNTTDENPSGASDPAYID